MTNPNDPISIDEAQSALGAIASANKLAQTYIQPPLLLRGLMSLLLGLITLTGAWSSGSGLWTTVMLASAASAVALFTAYYLLLRKNGIKLKLKSSTMSERVVNFSGSFIISLVIILAIEMHRSGYVWVPPLACVVNVCIAYYLFSHYTASGRKIDNGAEQ